MRCLLLTAALLFSCFGSAQAKQICFESPLSADSRKSLEGEIYNFIRSNVPRKYLPKLLDLKIIVAQDEIGSGLLPYIDRVNETSSIYINELYLELNCRLHARHLIDYLIHENIKESVTCDSDESLKGCLMRFSRGTTSGVNYEELEVLAIANDLRLPLSEVQKPLNSYTFPIIFHELAHHLLNHFERIENGDIDIVVAELEADLFGITSAYESGLVPLDYDAVFEAASDFENSSNSAQPGLALYESSECRAAAARFVINDIIPLLPDWTVDRSPRVLTNDREIDLNGSFDAEGLVDQLCTKEFAEELILKLKKLRAFSRAFFQTRILDGRYKELTDLKLAENIRNLRKYSYGHNEKFSKIPMQVELNLISRLLKLNAELANRSMNAYLNKGSDRIYIKSLNELDINDYATIANMHGSSYARLFLSSGKREYFNSAIQLYEHGMEHTSSSGNSERQPNKINIRIITGVKLLDVKCDDLNMSEVFEFGRGSGGKYRFKDQAGMINYFGSNCSLVQDYIREALVRYFLWEDEEFANHFSEKFAWTGLEISLLKNASSIDFKIDPCGDEYGSDASSRTTGWADNCTIGRTQGAKFAISTYSEGIQKILMCLGYFDLFNESEDDVWAKFRRYVDGNFGPVSEVMVRDYQDSNSLISDGIVSANLWRKLQTELVVFKPDSPLHLNFPENYEFYTVDTQHCRAVPLFARYIGKNEEARWRLVTFRDGFYELNSFSINLPFGYSFSW